MTASGYRRLAALAVLGAVAAACSREEPPPRASERPTVSAYPRDSGPSTVDVSSYPEVQREGYRLFISVCGTCHAPARALNAPYAGRADWKRFVDKMHVKMEARGVALSRADADQIVDFLVYDARVRKGGGGP